MKAFAPKRLIPTVNVKEKASFDRMVAKFADLMNLKESNAHIDRYFVVRKSIVDATSIGEPDAACAADSPASAKSSYSREVPQSPNQAGSDSAVALPCPRPRLCSGHSESMPVGTEPAQKLRKVGSRALQSLDPEVETLWYDSMDEVDVCEIFDL